MRNNLASSPQASRLNKLFSPDAKHAPLEHHFAAQNPSPSLFLIHVISCEQEAPSPYYKARSPPKFKCSATAFRAALVGSCSIRTAIFHTTRGLPCRPSHGCIYYPSNPCPSTQSLLTTSAPRATNSPSC